jgi:uncharacterized protein YegL
MKIGLLFISFIFCSSIFAQNLVVNGGFEVSDALYFLPSNKFNNEHKSGLELAPGWFTVTPATPDYFTEEFGKDTINNTIVLALNGKGRIGIIGGSCRVLFGSTQYKEYIQGSLSEPLIADKYYEICFYIAHDPRSAVASDNFGVLFSDSVLRSEVQKKLPQKPDLIMMPGQPILSESGWVRMKGTYRAKGGEKYIIIGSFSEKSCIPLSNLGKIPMQKRADQRIVYNAYYFLDEVSVRLTDKTKDEVGKDSLEESNSRREKFLLVVDVSSSMAHDGKLESLKSTMKEVVASLPEESEIGIISFHSKMKLVLPFTNVKEHGLIKNALDSLQIEGGTDFSDAMRFSYKYLQKESVKGNREKLIVFTDGVFEIEKSVQRGIKSYNKKYGTRFSVVHFGKVKNDDLFQLTTITEGKYVEKVKGNLKQKLDSVFHQENIGDQKFHPIYLSGDEQKVEFKEVISEKSSFGKKSKKNPALFISCSVLIAGLATAIYFIFR